MFGRSELLQGFIKRKSPGKPRLFLQSFEKNYFFLAAFLAVFFPAFLAAFFLGAAFLAAFFAFFAMVFVFEKFICDEVI
jgi:fatty-acid desaturase